jgi:hypothetical protein
MIVDHPSMAETVNLVFQRRSFCVTAQALRLNSTLLIDHPGVTHYIVHSAVSREAFEAFVRALEEGSELPVTPVNLSELSSLCDEFGADKMSRACDHFMRGAVDLSFEARLFGSGDRIESLAREVGLLRDDCQAIRKVEGEFKVLRRCPERVKAHERGLEACRLEVGSMVSRMKALESRVETAFRNLRREIRVGNDRADGEIARLKSEAESVKQSVAGLETLRPELDELNRAFRTWVPISLPMKEAKSLDGIISYLTRKHGGNVQEKGIVRITSKSGYDHPPEYGLKNVADPTILGNHNGHRSSYVQLMPSSEPSATHDYTSIALSL